MYLLLCALSIVHCANEVSTTEYVHAAIMTVIVLGCLWEKIV